MNYFGRSERQFEDMQRNYGMMPQEQRLTPYDKAGLGLQLGGAILSDIQESNAEDRALEEAKRRERNQMILGGRNYRQNAQQMVIQQQEAQRQGNISGFDRLTDMRTRAMDNALKYSTRKSFLRALGG